MENVIFDLKPSDELLKNDGVILLDDVGFEDKDTGVMGAVKSFLQIIPTTKLYSKNINGCYKKVFKYF